MQKGFMYIGVSIAASFIIGCGNGDLNSKEIKYNPTNIFDQVVLRDVTYHDYNVTAVDDPIVGATVSAKECNASIESNTTPGMYQLQGCISKPAFISIENGVMLTKDGNITQSFPLLLNTAQTDENQNFVVSPLTTLVATAEDNDTIDTVAKKLGLNKEDLFKDPREVNNSEANATDIAQKVNAIFIQAVENGSVVNKVNFINTVQKEINNSTDTDLNFTKVANNVNTVAQNNPDFFGFVMIPKDTFDKGNILNELHKTQNPEHLSFVGFVFDENFEANITIYEQNGTKITDANATTDKYGQWTITDMGGELNRTIYETNQTLTFEAIRLDNPDVVLKSSITTPKLRDLIEKQKKVTATKDASLIISNVTTAEYAMLDKRGVFDLSGDDSVKAYDGNKTEIKTYYNDTLLKAAATIKVVVDNNKTLSDGNNTYSLITDNLKYDSAISNNTGYTFDTKTITENNNISDTEISTAEVNVTSSPILKSQLNDIATPSITQNVDDNTTLTLEKIAKQQNYTFYRLSAYDDGDGTDKNQMVRVYEKLIITPGGSMYTRYITKGENNTTWQEVASKESNLSNFSAGNFVVTTDNNIIEYSLDANNSIYVEALNKSYNYYNIIETDYEKDGITVDKRTPVLWVDDFDVVDGYRRLDGTDYDNLWEEVKGLNEEQVNSKLNRYVKSFLDNVKDYFND